MEFDEQSLRKGIQFGLGSQGIWTPELEDVMFKEIHHQALSQDAVSVAVCEHKWEDYTIEGDVQICTKCDGCRIL